MRSQILLKPPYHFRPKTGYLLGLLGILFAPGMCTVQVMNHGPSALATGCWLWYLIAYSALYLLTYPSITVDTENITIRNPFVTSTLSYRAIVGLDTQYQLTLTTKRRRYRVLGAPAPGVYGSGVVQSVYSDIGGSTFSGESLMKVSSGGVAGDAGRLVAGYLKELRDTGEVEKMPLIETRRFDLIGGGIFLLLLALTLVFLFI